MLMMTSIALGLDWRAAMSRLPTAYWSISNLLSQVARAVACYNITQRGKRGFVALLVS
jgi:hypothetical protein